MNADGRSRKNVAVGVAAHRVHGSAVRLILRLRSMLPKGLDVTLLSDRGFRRVSLIRLLKQLEFHFVVRCCGKTFVRGEKYTGLIADLGVPRGKTRDLGLVTATKSRKPEVVRFVALFDHDQKDAWYLFTDLDVHASEVVRLCSRRFTIEEVFRDAKSTRYGWSLRESFVTSLRQCKKTSIHAAIARSCG